MERAIEVNEKDREPLLENILNLHFGRTYRVQTAYVVYEGILDGFVAKITKGKTTPHKIKLRNGFVFDFRYLGTDFEKIIPFLNKDIDYGNFYVKSYKEI